MFPTVLIQSDHVTNVSEDEMISLNWYDVTGMLFTLQSQRFLSFSTYQGFVWVWAPKSPAPLIKIQLRPARVQRRDFLKNVLEMHRFVLRN